jgi:predicted nucleotidyltransferase
MGRGDALDLLGMPSTEVRLIRFFLVRPDARRRFREIHQILNLEETSVQRALDRLVSLGTVDRTEEDEGTLYSVAPRSVVWRAFQLIASATDDPTPLLREAMVDVRGIVAAWIFGSTASGDAHDDSDIDVLVVEAPSLDRRALYGRTAEVSIILGRQVNTVRYSLEALGDRLGNHSDPAWGFLNRVMRGPKRWLVCDLDATTALAAATGISREELHGSP